MFGAGGNATSYNVKDQARSLTALEGDTDRNKFVVGSLDLRGDNEVREETREKYPCTLLHYVRSLTR